MQTSWKTKQRNSELIRDVRHSKTRRDFLRNAMYGTLALSAPGAFAEAIGLTPRQTEGPFYPDKLPLDTDNDLLLVNDAITPAVGEITHLTGRVLSASGAPVRNAVVEIWQVDNNGIYLHTRSPDRKRRDENFQGFGRFLTGSTGEFYFRTIKPVTYSFGGGRPPHIHFKVLAGGRSILTTQMYVRGHPLNQKDGILHGAGDAAARDSLLVDFKPLGGSKAGELTANFGIRVGITPEA